MNYRATTYKCGSFSFNKRQLNVIFTKDDLINMFNRLGISTDVKEAIKEVYELRVEFNYYNDEDDDLHSPSPLFIPLEELYVSGELENIDDLYEYIRVYLYLQLKDNVKYTLHSIVLKVEEQE